MNAPCPKTRVRNAARCVGLRLVRPVQKGGPSFKRPVIWLASPAKWYIAGLPTSRAVCSRHRVADLGREQSLSLILITNRRVESRRRMAQRKQQANLKIAKRMLKSISRPMGRCDWMTAARSSLHVFSSCKGRATFIYYQPCLSCTVPACLFQRRQGSTWQ